MLCIPMYFNWRSFKSWDCTNTIFSILGRNGTVPWHFFFQLSVRTFKVVEVEWRLWLNFKISTSDLFIFVTSLFLHFKKYQTFLYIWSLLVIIHPNFVYLNWYILHNQSHASQRDRRRPLRHHRRRRKNCSTSYCIFAVQAHIHICMHWRG